MLRGIVAGGGSPLLAFPRFQPQIPSNMEEKE